MGLFGGFFLGEGHTCKFQLSSTDSFDLIGGAWTILLQNSGSPLLAMPAIPQIQHRHSGYKSGPDPRIQLPQLPKQLDGKFVRGQMYTHQDSLPKLPVPPLEQTLRKYVKGIQV